MTAKVIQFPAARIVRIVPRIQPDVRLEFARRVERRMYEMEMQEVAKWLRVVDFMRGYDATPSDSSGDAA